MSAATAPASEAWARGEDGAALVELADLRTLLIVIAFGIIEFGNAWNRKLEVETAARAGARVGSGLGNDRTADKGLLQAASSVLNELRARQRELRRRLQVDDRRRQAIPARARARRRSSQPVSAMCTRARSSRT